MADKNSVAKLLVGDVRSLVTGGCEDLVSDGWKEAVAGDPATADLIPLSTDRPSGGAI